MPRPFSPCGQPCDAKTPCPMGFYCSALGLCTADCEHLSRDDPCPMSLCGPDGRCQTTR